MPVNPTVLNLARERARVQPTNARTQCSSEGMQQILTDFMAFSAVPGAFRRLAGIRTLDTAVANLRRSWPVAAAAAFPVWMNVDPHVEAVLRASRAWLDAGHSRGGAVQRAPAVRTLYWKVAWSYCSAHYAEDACTTIGHNGLVNATSAREIALPNSAFGNWYEFPNGAIFTHRAPPAGVGAAPLLRGDTRSPTQLLAVPVCAGFGAQHIGHFANYQPWFNGNANTDTISTTNDQALAIQAGPAARALGNPVGPMPPGFANFTGNNAPRGYVYELNVGARTGIEVLNSPPYRESVFLTIPRNCITRWWVVRADRHTHGPHVYHPLPAGPVDGSVGWSAAPSVLA